MTDLSHRNGPTPILSADVPVTLAGGGDLLSSDLRDCLALAPRLVAADGGADRLLVLGALPEAVIGDMDSISKAGRAALPRDVLYPVAEQDSTDFEKCLTRVHAPIILALGVLGPRSDHALAAYNTLVRHPDRRCILVDDSDIVLLAPPSLSLDLAPETRVSLFPMAPLGGRSTGLFWPIDGLEFAPNLQTGTSNRATGPVRLEFDAAAMLLILPRAMLPALIAAVLAAPGWPAIQSDR
ncbi:thiamine diphosphokinase [Pseudoruegeria sp. SK021]|uniref:thiamine diphosphokinase n=1 Tax=Pseudoruegeria sp. SK021 TaxID=1933035 RepID=UPI000A243362|nr:thiamine diphosphokinase [Pseudoruegeria sp. SK021]OSP56702.1 thiamine diphosphokinase [Pseudoruegeria sp. SK021]